VTFTQTEREVRADKIVERGGQLPEISLKKNVSFSSRKKEGGASRKAH